jgi:hypothetical protein
VCNLKVDRADRKRLVAASAVTLLVLPLVIKESRRHAGDRPTAVAAVSPSGGLSASLGFGRDPVAAPTRAPATTTTTVGVLVGEPVPSTTVPPPASAASTLHPSIEGMASFMNPAPGQFGVAAPCFATADVKGSKLTVTDTDNGHTASCTVVRRGSLPGGVLVQLDATNFLTLEDLVQAPVPVTVSW